MTSPDPRAVEVQLLTWAAAGDPQAFARLYDENVDRVYRYLLARTGEAAQAEDLTSEVFLRAWQRIADYRVGSTPYVAWLFRVAKNAWIDDVRRRREQPFPARPVADGTPGPERTAEAKLQAEAVRLALSELTEEQREVLALRFYGGLTTRQIASAIGKSEGSIRAVQLRGLRALARRLGGHDV